MTHSSGLKAGQPLVAVIGLCMSWSMMRVMAHDPFGRVGTTAQTATTARASPTKGRLAMPRRIDAEAAQASPVPPHAIAHRSELLRVRNQAQRGRDISASIAVDTNVPLLTDPVFDEAVGPDVLAQDLPVRPSPSLPAPVSQSAERRVGGGGWMIVRPGSAGTASGAPGLLGGSQIGSRFLLPVGRALSLMAGANAPLHGRAGREVRLGLSWTPVQRLPVELIAERRIGISAQTPSRTLLMAAGGLSTRPGGGAWTVNSYAQAGVSLGRERLGFAEGQAVVTRRLGSSALHGGGGVWGGAQPGLTRFDMGPVIELPLTVQGRAARLSVQWRQRLSGNARPASGPALTLGADF